MSTLGVMFVDGDRIPPEHSWELIHMENDHTHLVVCLERLTSASVEAIHSALRAGRDRRHGIKSVPDEVSQPAATERRPPQEPPEPGQCSHARSPG